MSVALLSVLITGCATTQSSLYHWGHYEQLLYDAYNRPDKAEPELQIEKLTQDIEDAQGAGKRVPPGIYAHLGYLFIAQGNRDQSMAAFLKEKELYPESAVFIDGIMARLTKGDPKWM